MLLLVSIWLLFRAPLPGLDGLASHRARPSRLVQLKIESARVTNWLLILVPSPKRRHSCLAISAGHTSSPIRFLGYISGRLREWPVSVVVLMVEAAGVAQVVACFVSAPQRCCGCAAIHAFFTRCNHINRYKKVRVRAVDIYM